MTPLDFATERDDRTASWRRADPRAALIERTAWNRWVVTLPDGEHAHDVRLERDHGAYVGECYTLDGDEREPCPGNAYHDGPCAHLCTVRKAAFGDVTDAFEAIGQLFEALELHRLLAVVATDRVDRRGGALGLALALDDVLDLPVEAGDRTLVSAPRSPPALAAGSGVTRSSTSPPTTSSTPTPGRCSVFTTARATSTARRPSRAISRRPSGPSTTSATNRRARRWSTSRARGRFGGGSLTQLGASRTTIRGGRI